MTALLYVMTFFGAAGLVLAVVNTARGCEPSQWPLAVVCAVVLALGLLGLAGHSSALALPLLGIAFVASGYQVYLGLRSKGP